jgi:hypothetical protein
MLINFNSQKRIRFLKKRIKYIDECLDFFNIEIKSSVNVNNTKIINKFINENPSILNKRDFALSLINYLNINKIKISYYEAKIIYKYLKVGHQKIYLKSYDSYYKLIKSH